MRTNKIQISLLNWNKNTLKFTIEASTLSANNVFPTISTYYEEYIVVNPETGNEVTFSMKRVFEKYHPTNITTYKPGVCIDYEGDVLYWVYEPIGVTENTALKNVRLIIFND